MSKTVDYKQKYYALRDQMIRSVDFAYRMGYEAAAKEAQIQQAQMQAQQAQMQAQAMQAQMQQMQGQIGQEQPQDGAPEEQMMQEQGAPDEQVAPEQMGQDGSELDQHIQALEEAISKSEGDVKESLQKSLDVLKKTQNLISKDPSPFKLTKAASDKLSLKQKEQLSMQQEILNNVLTKWEKEGQEAISNINQSLGYVLTKHEHD